MQACAACGATNPADQRFCGGCGSALAPRTVVRDTRKTVTALFCDLVGSTTLGERHDPEVLRPLLEAYFAEMRVAVERHGGRVHKFIGDAVSAVFGLPKAHEDDALRAVRAGMEMQARLLALNERSPIPLAIRVGITTGEVLVPSDDSPLIGDAMNTASRLQTGAAPGDVLIGEPTWLLVRDAVVADPVDPIQAKGKAEPVLARKVTHVSSEAPTRARRLDSPMVGREREADLIARAYERCVSDRACQLFTVLGTAGSGKSRLIEESIASFVDAEVILGRCLPYGDDITFYPVAGALKQALGIADFDDASSVRTAIDHAVAGDDHAEAIAANLAKLLAAGEGGSPEETLWAIRRFFEIRGAARPLVVVFDDIHWGEETFLDMIEHVADWSRDSSILLLCMARPDLLDIRPAWSGGKTNASTISLAPLSERESAELIGHLLGAASLATAIESKISRAAEGNPLFVEEMLRMLVDEGLLVRGDEGWLSAPGLDQARVPPTISALLAARLDLLTPAEHAVIERAAVIGRSFHRAAIASLWPEASPGDVDASLRSLVRKELITPERSALPGHDAFRFRHLLIRDAAYDQVPKGDRAGLHAALADWLEGVAGDRIAEQEEVVAYHLEQALRFHAELGIVAESDRDLARRAAVRLTSAASRAGARNDFPAAAGLCERSLALLSVMAPERPGLQLALGVARFEEGRFAEAEPALQAAAAGAREAGDRALELRAEMQHLYLGCFTHPDRIDLARLRSEASQATEILRAVGDGSGLSFAFALLAAVSAMEGDLDASAAAAEQAVTAGKRSGSHPAEALATFELGYALFYGRTPVPEAVAACRVGIDAAGGNRLARSVWLAFLAALEAMAGDVPAAEQHLDDARRTDDELGLGWNAGVTSNMGTYLELFAGRPHQAEVHARSARALFQGNGDTWYLAIAIVDLGRTLCEQGRFAEALDLLPAIDAVPAGSDLEWRIKEASVRAATLAGVGRAAEAEPLALEAVRLAAGTGFVGLHADAELDLARVLFALGRHEEARAQATAARDRYRSKGNGASEAVAAALAG